MSNFWDFVETRRNINVGICLSLSLSLWYEIKLGRKYKLCYQKDICLWIQRCESRAKQLCLIPETNWKAEASINPDELAAKSYFNHEEKGTTWHSLLFKLTSREIKNIIEFFDAAFLNFSTNIKITLQLQHIFFSLLFNE